MYTNVISENEKRSVCFYQGGVNITLKESEQHLIPFYQVTNAYEVMNTLLFPGIKNEQVRISEESRELNPILLDYMPELIKVYCDIYSAMCKYTYCVKNSTDYYLYRKDRMNTLQFLEKGSTPCFFSTSFVQEIKPYFHEKAGLILLELEVPTMVEHLSVNDVLGDLSIHPDEEEILLSPFLCLNLESMVLSEKEALFKDKNGESPKGKYKIYIKDSSIPARFLTYYDNKLCEELKERIMNKEAIENAKMFWKALENGTPLESTMIGKYNCWKENIRNYLKKKFANIKAEIQYNEKWEMFKNELSNYLYSTNERRVEYDSIFTKMNLGISCMQPLSALFLALSFINEGGCWGTVAKIISLIASTGCVILAGIVKSLALEGKCQQRTKIYFRLDELERDIRYEDDRSLERLNEYIEKFKQIMKEDDTYCIDNMNGTLAYFQNIQSDNNHIEKKG